MIYDVFLPFIIIFSIFSIIIILARKIPDISLDAEAKKDPLEEEAKKQHRMTVIFCKVLSILEKTLRQFRIHILKLDAKIFSLIQYLRDKSAKKLEEINKLSYKSFVPTAEKKINTTQSLVKTQAQSIVKPQPQPAVKLQGIESDALSVVKSVKKTPLINPSHTSRIIKAPVNSNKTSIKVQFKIEERKLLHIIAKNPKNAENYKNLGMLYFENENFLDAEAAFIEYLKLNPLDNEIKEMLNKIVSKNETKDIITE